MFKYHQIVIQSNNDNTQNTIAALRNCLKQSLAQQIRPVDDRIYP